MGGVEGRARKTCLRIGWGSALVLLLVLLLGGQSARAVEEPDAASVTEAESEPSDSVDRRVLDRARALLERRQARQAYELLAPHELDWSGDPEYDYLLGTAAVESGRPGEGVMPLERAVDHYPDDTGVRMALARAYYFSGDRELARSELDALGVRGLPPEFDAGLVAARRDERPRQRTFRYFVLFDGGYDTNVNAGADRDTFLGILLNQRNVAKESAYAAVSNGGVLKVPLSSEWEYDLKFNFLQRRNFSATFANTDRAGLANEFVWRGDYARVKFGAGVHTTYLDSRAPYDGDRVQNGAVLDFGARWLMGDSSWEIGTDVVFAALRHDRRIRVFDVDQLLTAFTLDYLSRGPQPSFGIALIAGEAQAKRGGSPYGRGQFGARLTSSWPVGAPGKMYSYLDVIDSDYDGRFFGRRRDDTLYRTGISAVLNVFPSRNWSLIPHFAYINNQSNVALFDYDRIEVGLAVRWISD